MTSGLEAWTGRGMRFTIGGALFNGLLQALGLMILARLLLPADYAVFAITLVLSGMTVQVVAVALERAIIISNDKDRITDYFLSALIVSLLAIVLPFAGYALAARVRTSVVAARGARIF